MEAPEDERPSLTRPALWTKLLEGGVTEVYVPGFEYSTFTFLPHTLGLEPIDSRAYAYDGEGVPRDADALEELARQFSSETRWIAGGGPWFWDVHFAERAEVILIFLLDDEDWHRRHDVASTEYVARAARWLKYRLISRRQAKNGSIGDSPPLQAPFLDAISGRGLSSSMEAEVNNVLAQYPEKVFVTAEWDTGQRLRGLRAH